MLKNAWLQALLMRPAKMKANPGSYFRPAVFICDEYQAFASVGEDDPSGDEKSFALTRQCRCIPIATISSLAGRLGKLGSVALAVARSALVSFSCARPKKMKANPGSYFRPAVFICDEYQAFASVGEDDPSGNHFSTR